MSTDENSSPGRSGATYKLLNQVAAHLMEYRKPLLVEWIKRISENGLLSTMEKRDVFLETRRAYDSYVEALKAETTEAQRAHARSLSELFIQRKIKTYEVVEIMLLLRDVVARFLFTKYQPISGKWNHVLDVYEPAANRIVTAVALGFVQERDRVICQYQETMRELSVRL